MREAQNLSLSWKRRLSKLAQKPNNHTSTTSLIILMCKVQHCAKEGNVKHLKDKRPLLVVVVYYAHCILRRSFETPFPFTHSPSHCLCLGSSRLLFIQRNNGVNSPNKPKQSNSSTSPLPLTPKLPEQ